MDQSSHRSKTTVKNKTNSTNEKEGTKRTRRRGSVDSALLGPNKYSLHVPCQREKSSLSDTTDKRRVERRNSYSFTSKKDRELSVRDVTKSKTSSPISKSTYVTCESELKPILKSCSRTNGLRPTVSMDDALSTKSKQTQTTENKFSYRLPEDTKKTSIRKSVSFREDSVDEYSRRPRRFSSPSYQLTFSPTKTLCPEFVDPI
ncbi:hypothetical protein FSP39_024706 [Pinctada imbricata]|uniref:Uncharacterized protein n=1 Tax=Pinctada imbricata TaxID=66713 RepID=A0AA88Y1J5_PINIB|nr:hypothetical protein FSP39_024706 [Pinctada imbricata]